MEEMFFCPNCMGKSSPADGKCPVCGCDVNIQNAPYQLPVNTILNGRYIIGKVLGAGGFGITYIGYDLKLDSRVAIKEYYPSGAANRSVSLTVIPTTEVMGNPFELGKTRFLKEAKTLSEFVGDGNIVTLRDYFEENGTAYIVMEYLEGKDLSHYAREHGRFEFSEALNLLEPVMLALDEVHKKGLIHRDISPSNIMVLNNGKVKVLDFGSARLQNMSGKLSLSVMLKPGYAPMEQYSTHGEQGSWTDVYAMSATIYRLITGKTPPTSTDRLMEDTLEPPSKLGVKITPAQEEALLHGLALRPADRTRTMAELAKELRDGLSVPDRKSEEKGAPKKSLKQKKGLLIIAAAVLAILALCVVVLKAMTTTAVPADQSGTDVTASPADSSSESTPDEKLNLTAETVALHRDTTVNGGIQLIVGLQPDGTIVAAGNNVYGQCDVSDWADIAAVSAGEFHTVGLITNGTAIAVGDNRSGQCDVSAWTDIVAIDAGGSHTVGLKSDSTVIAVGDNHSGQCDVSAWTDIVAVSAGSRHTVGLKSDGTVIITKTDTFYGRCEVSGWTDIVAVSAGEDYTVGLKSDGTVVADGMDNFGERDVSDWTNIVAVSAGTHHTVGLKSNGTVVAEGYNNYGQCDVSDWVDIVAVSAGDEFTTGLKSDGTVVISGNKDLFLHNPYKWKLSLPGETSVKTYISHSETTISAGNGSCLGVKPDGTVVVKGSNSYGSCNVFDWTNIAAVSAGYTHNVGLKSDGTVVAVGANPDGQCEVSDWTNIVAVSAGCFYTVGLKSDGTVVSTEDYSFGHRDVSTWANIAAISAGNFHAVGLKSDGTVVAVGDNDYSQCNVSDWDDIVAVSAGGHHTVGLKSDGTVVAVGENEDGQCDVSDWTDIVAVSAGDNHTVGLKSDGTVVAVGDNIYGTCDVSGWTDIVAVSAGEEFTVGLKTDGTVVAVGTETNGLGTPYKWKLKLP